MKTNYEIECDLYALNGDPYRDHLDHEFNSQYDRYNGWGDPEAAFDEMPYDEMPSTATRTDLGTDPQVTIPAHDDEPLPF